MKKLIFTSALISFAVMSYAQWFTGGNIGFTHDLERREWPNHRATETLSEFAFAPMFGYQSDRFAFGASVGLVLNTATWKGENLRNRIWITSNKDRETTALFGIQPFVRYTFAEFGKFSVFANAGIHFLTGPVVLPRTYHHWGPRWDHYSSSYIVIDPRLLWWPPYPIIVMERYDMNSFGINITPVLSYNLSEKISLEATLNFMNLGWNRTSLTPEDEFRDDKTIERNFGIGVNSGNIVDVGAISIGFIYKFRESNREPRPARVREPRPARTREPRPPRPGAVITVPSLE